MKKLMKGSLEKRLVIARETVKTLVAALPYAELPDVRGGVPAAPALPYISTTTTQETSRPCGAV